MRKLITFEFIEMLNDNKIKVKINNKCYIRTIKRSVNDTRYIVVNKREYYL